MPKPIPREILFGNPEKVSPKISPDGRHLAYLAPDEGVLNIWAGPLEGTARPITRDRGRGIRSYFWAENGRNLLFLQDKDGDENWRLHLTDLEGSSPRDLTPFPEVQAQVVATDPRFPDDVLAALNARDKRLHDVYRLDLKSGKLSLEVENPGDVVGWLADSRLQARCAKAMRPDGGSELRLRNGKAWKTLISWDPEDQGGAHSFAPGDGSLYVESSHDSDTTCLWELGLDGKPLRLLARAEGSDLTGVLIHPSDYRAQAAAFFLDRLSWTVLDESLKPDFEALQGLAEGDFQVVSRDDSDENWILLYNRDREAPAYYLYSRSTRKGRFLFSTRPRLEGTRLSEMRPLRIKARDGLVLPAYLTLPAGEEPRGLPLVLNVHGGPWARDFWGYNPEVQWLASRGYAVLQVNYRGSMGFGKSFLHAGDREWGARMQNDLTDSVLWAAREGIADPGRLAIYGGSYGGYAALSGAAFTPELYCCAVDMVGPSNLATLIRSIPPYWEPLRRIFDLRVGDVDTELEFLNSRSPLYKAHQIRIPLLIAQGANDPRVKRSESEAIVEALRAKGSPVEYILFEDEGHGLARPENRLRFYEKAEAFLERHLKKSEEATASR